MKGAVSRVKPLQSWVRFDYIGLSGAGYQAAFYDRYRIVEKDISQPVSIFPFPYMSCQVTCCPLSVFVKL